MQKNPMCFTIRVTPELHRKIKFKAIDDKLTMNGWIINVIKKELHRRLHEEGYRVKLKDI
jgi:predicted HicB family RNase H-like nuclease